MRRAILAASLFVGAIVFCLIGNVRAGELDSLQKVINLKCDSLYSTAIGHEIQRLPADSIPQYLSFLLQTHVADTIQVYEVAQKVQVVASLEQKAAHIKVKCNLVRPWQGENEAKAHSHTVAVIDHWFEGSAFDDEPTVQPVRLKLDIPDRTNDVN
jgi:hypothetical protein